MKIAIARLRAWTAVLYIHFIATRHAHSASQRRAGLTRCLPPCTGYYTIEQDGSLNLDPQVHNDPPPAAVCADS